MRLSGPYASTGIAWSPRGDEVWSSSPLTATTLSGKPREAWTTPGAMILHDLGKDGKLLVSAGSPRREIVGVTADGLERNLTWFNWSFPTAISADGKTVLFDEQSVQPQAIYLRALNGAPAIRLGEGKSYALSPDGRWALTAREMAGVQLTLLPTGPGEPRPLAKTQVSCQGASFFPDGRRILLSGNEPGRSIRLFVQDLSNGKPRAISPEGVTAARSVNPISPDGKTIAAYGPDGRLTLYPVEPGEPRPVPGIGPEDLPLHWAPDGRALYVARPSAEPGRIDLVDIETGRRTLWKQISPPDPAGIQQIGPVVIAPDGSSYVYSYRRVLNELGVATGLR